MEMDGTVDALDFSFIPRDRGDCFLLHLETLCYISHAY